MSNVDNPNGFRPVKTMSGRGWGGMVRTVPVNYSSGDIFIGDMLNLGVNGLAKKALSADTSFLGVAIGFGKKNADGVPLGAFNPASLERRYFDAGDAGSEEWVCYYVPAEDMIFEAQTSVASVVHVGGHLQLASNTGDTTTGMSRQEIFANSLKNFFVVESPLRVDNDPSKVWGRYWVVVNPAYLAFHT